MKIALLESRKESEEHINAVLGSAQVTAIIIWDVIKSVFRPV